MKQPVSDNLRQAVPFPVMVLIVESPIIREVSGRKRARLGDVNQHEEQNA